MHLIHALHCNIYKDDCISKEISLVSTSLSYLHCVLNPIEISLLHRIQDIDGGFFEKFSSLLGQKSKEMLASAPFRSIAFGPKFSATIPPRLAQDDLNDISPESLHEDIISQLENPTAKKDDVIKEYSGLNVSKY